LELINPNVQSLKINPDLLSEYKSEWLAFMKNGQTNKNLIPSYVLDSWKRSRSNHIDPYDEGHMNDIDNQFLDTLKSNESLKLYLSVNKNVRHLFKSLASIGFIVNFNIITKESKSITCQNNHFCDVSEQSLGTTSISLATSSNSTVFICGALHFKEKYHHLFCFSRPITSNKTTVGILTITARDFNKINETYALLLSISEIIEREYSQNQTHALRAIGPSESNKLHAHYSFKDIIGSSKSMMILKENAYKISKNDLPILIQGENGTGKELFAQSIHNASDRSSQAFVGINCGAISRDLVESELFGYEPGAFTGALTSGKKGVLETANGGTVFLDEIDSMPIESQVKLLRAISSKEITRIGSVIPTPLDIRIISSTKENLLKRADKNLFREDLYYRIAYFTLNIPPLRERVEDIPDLVNSFVEMYALENNCGKITITESFIDPLRYFFWRGNIRELRSVVYTSLAMCNNAVLDDSLLSEKIIKAYNYKKTKLNFSVHTHELDHKSDKLKDQIHVYEELIIQQSLMEHHGNVTKAALDLGISKKSLYRKLENYPNIKKSLQSLKG